MCVTDAKISPLAKFKYTENELALCVIIKLVHLRSPVILLILQHVADSMAKKNEQVSFAKVFLCIVNNIKQLNKMFEHLPHP